MTDTKKETMTSLLYAGQFRMPPETYIDVHKLCERGDARIAELEGQLGQSKNREQRTLGALQATEAALKAAENDRDASDDEARMAKDRVARLTKAATEPQRVREEDLTGVPAMDAITVDAAMLRYKTMAESWDCPLCPKCGARVEVVVYDEDAREFIKAEARRLLTGSAAPGAQTEPAERQLDEVAALPANWDSYGGKAPDSRAVHTARMLLRELAPTSTPHVCPMSDGGIQLGFTGDLEVTISPDGFASASKAQPAPAVAPVACTHPEHLRHGSADSTGRITKSCAACGKTLYDHKIELPTVEAVARNVPAVATGPGEDLIVEMVRHWDSGATKDVAARRVYALIGAEHAKAVEAKKLALEAKSREETDHLKTMAELDTLRADFERVSKELGGAQDLIANMNDAGLVIEKERDEARTKLAEAEKRLAKVDALLMRSQIPGRECLCSIDHMRDIIAGCPQTLVNKSAAEIGAEVREASKPKPAPAPCGTCTSSDTDGRGNCYACLERKSTGKKPAELKRGPGPLGPPKAGESTTASAPVHHGPAQPCAEGCSGCTAIGHDDHARHGHDANGGERESVENRANPAESLASQGNEPAPITQGRSAELDRALDSWIKCHPGSTSSANLFGAIVRSIARLESAPGLRVSAETVRASKEVVLLSNRRDCVGRLDDRSDEKLGPARDALTEALARDIAAQAKGGAK